MPRNSEPRRAQIESPDLLFARSLMASLLCLSLAAALGVPALLSAFTRQAETSASEQQGKADPQVAPSGDDEAEKGAVDPLVLDLVEDLADPSYRVRKEARSLLQTIGKAALEELRTASKSKDPELRESSLELIETIKQADSRPVSPQALPGRGSIIDGFVERFRGSTLRRGGSFPFGGAEEQMRRIDQQIREMEERLRRGTGSRFPDPFFPLTGGGWSGSSRVEIWSNGEKVFDSEDAGAWTFALTLGMRLESIGEALRAHLPIPAGEGLITTEVRPETPAQEAGVKKFDIILAVGMKPVTGLVSFSEAFKFAGGKPVEVKIIRGGEAVTLEIELPKKKF